MTLRLAIVVFAALAIAARAQAPEGFKTVDNPGKGFSLFIPITFDEIPVPPDSQYLQMKFVEKLAAGTKAAFPREMRILKFELGSVATGEAVESSPASKPAAPGPPKIRSFQDYVTLGMRGWKATADGNVATNSGLKLERYKLTQEQAVGVAYSVDTGDDLVALVCVSPKDTIEEIIKKFERTAKSLSVKDPSDSVNSNIELFYKQHAYRNVDYRKKVRSSLPTGWKAEDTENLIIVYDVKDKILINKMKRDLEVLRKKLVELFPPVRPVEAVSTVRVCKDRDEFLKFSELDKNTRVAGFWNVRSQELVFYNNVKDPNYPTASWEDALVVLYHEAFHQYIYYACGEIDPHSWFNEGYGDYFSGSKITDLSTKVERIQVNPWRVGAIQKAIEEKKYIPIKEIIRYEQAEYYNPVKIGICYPQGWSIIYFLNDAKTIKKHPSWGRILPTYLKTIIQVYQSELNRLGEKATREQVGAARLAARKAAVDAAFEDVDFTILENEWKAFILQLKDPRGK